MSRPTALPTPGTTAKAKRTKEVLLRSAESVFGEKGFERTSITDITQSAGVAQGTFYLHFLDKKAIFLALIEELGRELRAALRAAVRYTQDRKVFGLPLADFALTQAKIARMGARLAACRRLAYTVAGIVDTGQGRMEASLVKLLACRSAEFVTREALQLHGGMGYAEETAVSRYFVDGRVLSIFEGAEETLALKVIARSLMERALGIA